MVPLLAVLLLVAGLVGVGLVHVAAAASRQAAAQAAADAAALAGAADGREAAERVAAANGARLMSYEELGTDVVVRVQRQGHRARARGRWSPAHPGAP